MMDDTLLRLLPSLVALVEGQSVTQAARRMGISQPRMTARLADLRRLTGDPLLVAASRSRGLIATGRAMQLAEAARQGLTDLDAAFSARDFDPATAQRTFAIMANDNAAVILGAPLVEAIRAAAGPDIRVALFAYDATRLAGLEHGALDLVLGSPHQLAAMPSLISRVVLRDSFATAATADDAPAAIDLDTFCDRDHVLVSGDGGGFDGVVDAALADMGRTRRVFASVQSYLVAIELVASSAMLATLPRALLARRSGNIALHEPPVPLQPFILSAAWHPRMTGDPAHQWLRDQLALCADLARRSSRTVEASAISSAKVYDPE